MPPRSVHRNDQAYLTVGAAAKYLGTTTAKVSVLVGMDVLEMEPSRASGRLFVSVDSLVRYRTTTQSPQASSDRN